MAYEKQNWQNDVTPLNDAHLNHMEDGIERANNTIVVTTDNTDLNDYTETGLYFFGTSYTPINIPTSLVNGWVSVIKSIPNSFVKQIFYRGGTADKNDYETYVRTRVGGIWSNWQRLIAENDLYYKVGDSQTINWTGGGVLTSAKQEVQFSIPLPKNMSNVTPSIASGNIFIRRPTGGYILQEDSITNANEIKKTKNGNLLRLQLIYNTPFNDEVNNIPLGIQITNLVINFE